MSVWPEPRESFVESLANSDVVGGADGNTLVKRRKVKHFSASSRGISRDLDSEDDITLANCKKTSTPAIPAIPAIPAPPTIIYCAVCMESLEPERFYQDKITPSCGHESRICTSCVTQSVDIQILDVSWDMIKCPLCPELMPFECVKEIASQEAFQRYFKSVLGRAS